MASNASKAFSACSTLAEMLENMHQRQGPPTEKPLAKKRKFQKPNPKKQPLATKKMKVNEAEPRDMDEDEYKVAWGLDVDGNCRRMDSGLPAVPKPQVKAKAKAKPSKGKGKGKAKPPAQAAAVQPAAEVQHELVQAQGNGKKDLIMTRKSVHSRAYHQAQNKAKKEGKTTEEIKKAAQAAAAAWDLAYGPW